MADFKTSPSVPTPSAIAARLRGPRLRVGPLLTLAGAILVLHGCGGSTVDHSTVPPTVVVAPAHPVASTPLEAGTTVITLPADDDAVGSAATDVPPATCDPSGATDNVALSADRVLLSSKIAYHTGKPEVRETSLPLLNELAALMCQRPELRIEIGVHTDTRGVASANMVLSQGRAEAVQTALWNLGIARERVIARGYGETQPITHAPPNELRRTVLRILR